MRVHRFLFLLSYCLSNASFNRLSGLCIVVIYDCASLVSGVVISVLLLVWMVDAVDWLSLHAEHEVRVLRASFVRLYTTQNNQGLAQTSVVSPSVIYWLLTSEGYSKLNSFVPCRILSTASTPIIKL